MGGLTGSNTPSTPKYTSLQSQTSVQDLPIPILWGANRLSGNCIDVFNFTSQPADKGKGGKGQLTYSASVVIALCVGAREWLGWAPHEGTPNTTIGRAWQDGQEVNFADLGFGFYSGNDSQEPWASAAAIGHNLAYRPIAYLANGNLALGESATVPNNMYEVFGAFRSYHVGESGSPPVALPDANFGDIILDLLTNYRYGLDMPTEYIDTSSLVDLTNYHQAVGIFVSPILKDQEQVSSILQRWATIGNFWVFWNGTVLKTVPLGDSAVTGNGATFTPNLTPVYALGPDDFQVADKNANKSDPPVTVTRKDPADGYNVFQLNCSIRDNQYQDTPYRWFDQTAIDKIGVQAPNVISSSEICYESTAALCVQLVGQRQLYIRNDYAFKLLPNFILLEPGDLVTLTEPNIGLSDFAVRIKSIDEDDKGYLSVVAEEFVYGVGTATGIDQEPWAGGEPWNVYTAGPSVNTPAFIQPDLSLTQGTYEVWAALSGGENWGGCGVFVSFDGLNYTQVGTNENASAQGTLTASLALESGLDTLSTLSVDTTLSDVVLSTGATDADAAAYRTLVLVDDELMAYGSVTPTGAYTANLTYLERGLYGTTPAAHMAGASFSRIDSTKVFAYPTPTAYLGDPLYFKFPSVNAFGNAAQGLAECEEYTFTPPAPPIPVQPAPANVTLSYVYDGLETASGSPPHTSQVNALVTCAAPGSLVGATEATIRWSAHPSGTSGQIFGTQNVTVAQIVAGYTIPWAEISLNGDGYAYFSVQWQAAGDQAASAWSSDATAAIPPPTALTASNQYNSDGSFAGVALSWTAPAVSNQPSSYNILGPYAGEVLGTQGGYSTTAFVPAYAATPVVGAWGKFEATVQAVYGGLGSLPAGSAAATNAAPLPALLTSGVSGTAASASAQLSWTPAGTTPLPTFYRIFYYYYTGGSTLHLAYVDIAAPAATYTLRGLTSGQAYSIAVVTYNAAGTAEVFAASVPTLSETITVTPS